MQKIKRTDVKRKGGRKTFLKVIILTLVFVLLFVVGFIAASYITKLL